ncbi:hypothetical protein CYV19_00510 [Natronobacterium gregoryi SP2]|uniref:Uncharacterized protein n=1 Tax=Natronobacterium gregoryi (strain ATCC 43098 / DSM 3393 / CCM 3738 / CIP 104747 / IAM 13177 / JCM 8860 / NBRC 102187 / NCIMB 2189 / SP2) TaxID=797304 RepID=A0A2J4JK06_NATGS|nr:hypothetical protein CYV19_00510 [Natronobacterium gregoryi SP2]
MSGRVAIATGEWVSPALAPLLLVVIVLATVGTTVLFVVGFGSYLRRRTVRYRLLTVVLGLLVVRSAVGLGTVFAVVPMTVHHLVEHGIDVLIATSLLYLVVRERPPGTAYGDGE